MFLGVVKAAADTSTAFSKLALAEPLHDLNAPDNMGLLSLPGRLKAFSTFLGDATAGIREGTIDRESVLEITRAAWRDIVDAAERFNEPGRFTTFIGFEYTSSTDDHGNLHRNVLFESGDEVPAVPFSRFHSQNPEGLWKWMDGLRAQGIESLAIPHNSNGSNGQMFKLVDWAGNPMDDAYAERRIRNEPLVEITQVKGTSETHPSLSTKDEWSDFEIMPYRVATMQPSEPAGSYVRDALRRGLTLESRVVTNPYEFGFIGSSDTHTGAISDDESNYFSKVGLMDATPELRGSVPLSTLLSLAHSFRGAPRCTPKSMAAPTSTPQPPPTGPRAWPGSGRRRIRAKRSTQRSAARRPSPPRARASSLRFFAGYGFEDGLSQAPDAVARAYARGVSMGSDLPASAGEAPGFLVWALADPRSAPPPAPPDREGLAGRGRGNLRGRLRRGLFGRRDHRSRARTDVPTTGPGSTFRIAASPPKAGGAQLRALWRDPDFEPGARAFYYARVLENPTCRWSTWDALREGVAPRADLPKTIQERAWSSPIQYRAASVTALEAARGRPGAGIAAPGLGLRGAPHARHPGRRAPGSARSAGSLGGRPRRALDRRLLHR